MTETNEERNEEIPLNREISFIRRSRKQTTIYKQASDAGFTVEEIDAMVTIMSKTIEDYDEVVLDLEEQAAVNVAVREAVSKFLRDDQKLEDRVLLKDVQPTLDSVKKEYGPDIELMRTAVDKLKVLKVMIS